MSHPAADQPGITNGQFVGVAGDGLIVVTMPQLRMTKAEALRHAAWLVALADDHVSPQFPAILEAVLRT